MNHGLAAFRARGKSPLVVLTGRQNSEDYVYTVSENLPPFAQINYDTDFIYQQTTAAYMFLIVAGSSSMKREFRCLTGR